MAALLELSNISRRFGAVRAVEEVSIRFEAGEVHGVLGENGAGKSTLMNIAYGLLRADSGVIRSGGEAVKLASPRDAIGRGIGMVHQHFMLAGAMTVLDNVLLGDRRAGWWMRRATAARRLAQLGESIGLEVDPGARVEGLSVGEQQRVEILKALWREVKVLILDEPTAVLTPDESEQLFAAIERLKGKGKSIVFISHKLNEVKRICDRVTLLRRGRVVWEGGMAGVSVEELAGRMVGTEGENEDGRWRMEGRGKTKMEDGGWRMEKARLVPSSILAPQSSFLLSLENLTAPGLHDISLKVRRGEILGIAGVDGNGQQELAEVIVGLRRTDGGRIVLAGEEVTTWSMKRRMDLGLAHIPNDRKREALAPSMSVTENAVLKQHGRRPISRWGMIGWRRARELARRLVADFDIRAASTESPVAALSGGNQQKVVLARELGIAAPRVVVAMNPVRGLDLAATRFVFDRLRACRDAGAAVLLINSDLDELRGLCDRIAVLYGGRLRMTAFPETSREEIGHLMTGVGGSR